mmetsp:Transcript_43147/g.71740  ORF Transcript_43147/g.71740 Transcript_43147/m.71740 type:complete len:97 (+) Transcript_43147:251-541(+)
MSWKRVVVQQFWLNACRLHRARLKILAGCMNNDSRSTRQVQQDETVRESLSSLTRHFRLSFKLWFCSLTCILDNEMQQAEANQQQQVVQQLKPITV